MSVQALIVAGQLTIMANFLSDTFADKNIIALVLGVCSSFLDNVALVSATMGMYPIADSGIFAADSAFWTFLAYCAVTGGSILIIGSAAGVTVMGMEKISFGYYLKKFSLPVLLGYALGAAFYLFVLI
jgi:Na+/H+ antiporter NhaD/arsenite permease-like protein